MNTFLEGIKRGLISISEDEKTITYIHQNKSRNFTNPEEKVQGLWYVLYAARLSPHPP